MLLDGTDRPEATEPADIPSAPQPKIQADPHFNACGANGVVAGLDPSGEGFLAVRGGPGTQYGEIDRLHNGEQVYLCSESGKWFGVVYSKQRQNCNAPTPQSHSGACGFGWVHRNWIRQNEPSDMPPPLPPKIQADPRLDACRENGVVAGLDPSGEGFLAVRGGPGTQYGEIDRLHNGEQVYLCSERGKWLGVVYSKQRQVWLGTSKLDTAVGGLTSSRKWPTPQPNIGDATNQA